MGEIAEMMLDGTLCEGCGEYIGADSGYPQYCSAECARSRGASLAQVAGPTTHEPARPRHTRRRDTACPICKRKCRGRLGLEQHMIDKHGAIDAR